MDADSAFMILFDQFVYYLILVLTSLIRVKPVHICNTYHFTTCWPLGGSGWDSRPKADYK